MTLDIVAGSSLPGMALDIAQLHGAKAHFPKVERFPDGETSTFVLVIHRGRATRQVEVLAWVDNPGVLKPGFFAEVTLATGTHKGAVAVPESAVSASERGFVVFIVTLAAMTEQDRALEHLMLDLDRQLAPHADQGAAQDL